MTQPQPQPLTLTIHAARYYTPSAILDVTSLVRTLVTEGGLGGADGQTLFPACLTIQVCNETFLADPEPGAAKKFFLDYSSQGKRRQRTFAEWEWVYIYADDAEDDEKDEKEAGVGESADAATATAIAPAPPSPALTFTDIIIPTYNNAALTAACFRSIREHTRPGTFRVIWVDNGSRTDDMTLAAKELSGVNRIEVYLPTNLGFVGAVNAGLRISAASTVPGSSSPAPSVCLLNNDTLVTSHWLEKLNSSLYTHAELGIVGPLTAYSPATQCDSQHNLSYYDNLLPPEAHGWSPDRLNEELERLYPGQFCRVEFVAFLCAVLKREVIDKIGFLDTRFDMGMWDDVDYNRSAVALGYSVALAADTCIYHRGRATFAVVQKSERLNVGRLLSKNRAYLDEKWRDREPGTWTVRKPRAKAVMIALYPFQGQGLDAWLDHGAGMTWTAAKQAGADLDFIDMKALHNEKELQDRLDGYEIVAFGLKSSYYAAGMKIVEMAKRQGARVLVSGYHVTAAVQELLENPHIDWVLHGESELTFHKFLADPAAFPREFWGEKPPDLDALPWMDREMFRDPWEPVAGWWHPAKDGSRREKMVSVMAARGCPFSCLFCQPIERNHFGLKLRRRSVDSMIAEMLMLKEKYSPDCIMIHDDTFLVQRKWIEEFIEKYPQVGLPFWAAGRADGICRDPDLVKGLIGVGWELISVGFESGSQRILDFMKKGTTVEQNLEAARIVHSLGAKVYGNYMTALPWETREDIDATFAMAKEIDAEMPSFAFFAPYPGSELGNKCIAEGLSLLDRNNYDRCPSGIKCKGVDYDYVNKMFAEFNAWRAQR